MDDPGQVAQTLIAARYRLLRQLGVGGMGRVWLADDEMLGRHVAIKEVVIPAGLSPDEHAELRYRTLREARTAARLNHPHVVQIYDVVHSEQQPWIVMEYVPSRSLQEVINAEGSLDPPRVARIGVAVLDALVAAHRAGVLHRDVKPANVLLAEDGRVVLTDFGLATFDGMDVSVTSPGMVLGSIRFVAPERARNNTATPQTDLWALGATLYAAVEGQPPYARYGAMEVLEALATSLPDAPQRAGRLKPVLAGLLRRDPRDRFRPEEIRPLLERVATDQDRGLGRLVHRPRGRRSDDSPGSVSPSPIRARPVGPARPGDADDSPTEVVGLDQVALRPAEPVAEPAGPDRAGRPGGPGTRRLVAAVLAAAVVLLAAAGTLVVASVSGTDSGRATSHPAPSPPGTPATADLVLAAACPATYPIDAPSASRRPDWPALVPGWVWYEDRTGFRVAVPEHWSAYVGTTAVCFREPGDTRWMAVTWWSAGGDALTHVESREINLVSPQPPGGYQRVGFTSVPYYQGGADWEYRFLDRAGTAMHAITRDFLVGPRAGYTIVWCTRDFDWQLNLDNFRLVTASFAGPT
jgi:serine/threonine protein kinase